MTVNSKLLQSGVFVFLQRLLILVFGFGSFIILIRVFDKEDFGVWSLYVAITTLIETVRYGFVKSSQIRMFAISEPAKQREIMSASFILNLLLSSFVVIALVAASFFIDDLLHSSQLGALLLFYTLIYMVLVPHTYIEYHNESVMNFKINFMAYAIRQGVFFAILIFFVAINYKMELIQVAIIQFLSVIASLTYLILKAGQPVAAIGRFRWRDVKKMIDYGKYVFGTSVSSILSRNIDQFMISYFLGLTAVAVYNPALRISGIIEVPTTALATIVFPLSAKHSTGNRSYLKYLYEKSVGYNLGILIPLAIGVIVMAEPIVLAVAGRGYADATTILRLYILTVMFIPFGRQFGVIFDSIGKQKISFYLLFFSTLINIAFNYFFIRLWGLHGAVYAVLSTLFIRFVINQYLLNRVIDVKIIDVFRYTFEFYRFLIAQCRLAISRIW